MRLGFFRFVWIVVLGWGLMACQSAPPRYPSPESTAAFERGVELAEMEPAQAAEAFEQACDAGDAFGCAMLGQLHVVPGWDEADVQMGIKALERGCGDVLGAPPVALADAHLELGRQLACMTLAALYEMGIGVAQDLDRAFGLYEVTCALGAAHACAQVGYFYRVGMAVEVDVAKAYRFSLQACEAGAPMGCFHQGEMEFLGEGVEAFEAGRALIERSCEGGFPMACAWLDANMP